MFSADPVWNRVTFQDPPKSSLYSQNRQVGRLFSIVRNPMFFLRRFFATRVYPSWSGSDMCLHTVASKAVSAPCTCSTQGCQQIGSPSGIRWSLWIYRLGPLSSTFWSILSWTLCGLTLGLNDLSLDISQIELSLLPKERDRRWKSKVLPCVAGTCLGCRVGKDCWDRGLPWWQLESQYGIHRLRFRSLESSY